MKNSIKKWLSGILILVPAFYIGYHSIVNGAFADWGTKLTFHPHTWVLLAVILWLMGDYLLSQTK